MEGQTKHCPYCGGEIVATAKKCKHCGKWVEKKCPACGEWINAEANKCRYCGSWVSDYAKWKYEKETGIKEPKPQQPQQTLDAETLQEAMEDHEDAKQASCMLNIESVILVGIYGWYYDWSWVGFIVAFIVLEILLAIRFTRILFCLGATAMWAVFFYSLVGTWAAVVAAIVALCVHIPAFSKNFN